MPVIGKESQTVVLHQPDGSRISDKETLDRRFVYDPHDNMENFSPIPTKTTTVTVKVGIGDGSVDCSRGVSELFWIFGIRN